MIISMMMMICWVTCRNGTVFLVPASPCQEKRHLGWCLLFGRMAEERWCLYPEALARQICWKGAKAL